LKSTRATLVRLMWKWSEVKSPRPPDDLRRLANPSWVGYDLVNTGATIRDISTAGLTAGGSTSCPAPSWWEGQSAPGFYRRTGGHLGVLIQRLRPIHAAAADL